MSKYFTFSGDSKYETYNHTFDDYPFVLSFSFLRPSSLDRIYLVNILRRNGLR